MKIKFFLIVKFTLLLFIQMSSAQIPILIDLQENPPVKFDCLDFEVTNDSITTKATILKDSKVLILFVFNKEKDLAKLYKLLNLRNNKAIQGEFKSPDTLLFDIGDQLKGVKILKLQLTSVEANKCFNRVIIIEQSETVFSPGETLVSDLNLGTLSAQNPCSSCLPAGNIVTYDFSNNSVNNSKTVASTIRNFPEAYLFKRWTHLPRVNEELAFVVKNVNPFKYNVTLKADVRPINTDGIEDMLKNFTPSINGVKAIDDDGEKQRILQAIQLLGVKLEMRINEFRNAGDCFDPCAYIEPILTKIYDYFKVEFKYDKAQGLEDFLLGKIASLYEKGKEDAIIKEMVAVIAKFHSFRTLNAASHAIYIPQLKNVDQYVFTLAIKPKDGINVGARVVDEEIAVDILGGFKVDLSSGLYLSKMIDERYILRSDSSVIRTASGYADSIVYNRRNKVIKEKGRKNEFGVASLLHFYPKLTPTVNLAVSLGIGVSLSEKPKIRYLGGFSALFGKTNRLILSYGWTMGFAEQLSDRYKDQVDIAGNIYTASSEKSVELKKTFQFKQFASLTFSVPLIKKKEVVKETAPAADKVTTANPTTTSGSDKKTDK